MVAMPKFINSPRRMMHEDVGPLNGWRGRGGQYVAEPPNQTTEAVSQTIRLVAGESTLA
jgi:hypothetical protein